MIKLLAIIIAVLLAIYIIAAVVGVVANFLCVVVKT